MIAKVYDFDRSWDAADSTDDIGDYVFRDIDCKSSDETLVLKNGTRSHTYAIIQSTESICEICNPELNPLCTKECQDACPECNKVVV